MQTLNMSLSWLFHDSMTMYQDDLLSYLFTYFLMFICLIHYIYEYEKSKYLLQFAKKKNKKDKKIETM